MLSEVHVIIVWKTKIVKLIASIHVAKQHVTIQQSLHTEGKASHMWNNWMQMNNICLAWMQTGLSEDRMNVLFVNSFIYSPGLQAMLIINMDFNLIYNFSFSFFFQRCVLKFNRLNQLFVQKQTKINLVYNDRMFNQIETHILYTQQLLINIFSQ